jgi:hypothetical protein
VWIGDFVSNKPEREVEVPHTFDRWLVGALAGAGLFALFGFASFIQ